MKSTGIIRKVDELGRIVLPIEIRRTLDIAERDELEIFMDNDQIVLQKFNFFFYFNIFKSIRVFSEMSIAAVFPKTSSTSLGEMPFPGLLNAILDIEIVSPFLILQLETIDFRDWFLRDDSHISGCLLV